MISGITSRPFSAVTIAPALAEKDNKKREEIVKSSRGKYAHTRASVEDEINRWATNMDAPVRGSPDVSKSFYQTNNPKSPDQTKLYDVKCSSCGKDTKVIFEPTPGKPVYCKSCLKKIKDNKPEKPPISSLSQGAPEDAEALAGLGIEFGPPQGSRKESPRPKGPSRSLDSLIKEGERVSFNPNKNKGPQRQRKEVNLSDLKKALEESLGHSQTGEALKNKDSVEELEERIEQEKDEDKVATPGDKHD